MSRKVTTLDMTMMYAVHGALRRELAQVSRITSRLDDDPRRLLHSALGWELFSKFLHIHHTSEDVAVWPAVRAAAAERPDRLAVVEAMEAEHAKIDPLLAAVNDAIADQDYGHQRLGDLIDTLATELSTHLAHEESEGLGLIDATLTPEQWKVFADDHRARVGTDARLYLPWMLDGADTDLAATILSRMPEQLVAAYHDEWGPSYARLILWDTADEPTKA